MKKKMLAILILFLTKAAPAADVYSHFSVDSCAKGWLPCLPTRHIIQLPVVLCFS